MSEASKYELGAAATFYNQPPFESPAARWMRARTVTEATTVGELLEWLGHDVRQMESLQITVHIIPEAF